MKDKIVFEFGNTGFLILISVCIAIGILMGHYWWPA